VILSGGARRQRSESHVELGHDRSRFPFDGDERPRLRRKLGEEADITVTLPKPMTSNAKADG
jgi:hypothetical protein